MRTTFCSTIDSFSGFGQHGIEIIKALQGYGQTVSIRPLRVNEDFGSKIPPNIKAMFVGSVQPEPWEIVLTHPRGFHPTPGKRTAWFTMWESSKLPPEIVTALNRAELIVVPSAWGASCFSASGVTSQIRVVPLGVDPDVFQHKPFPKGIVFGTAGRLANGAQRKGVEDVIRWFQLAFPNETDVRLRVKVFPDCPLPGVEDKRVEIIRACFTPAQLSDWYASLTCFVSGARGEGHGLMQHQSMMCGRPVIASIFGGLTEFMSPSNSFAVPFRLVPAQETYAGCGLWAEPDARAAMKAMRDVYEHPKTAEYKGMIAAGSVRTLTWERHNHALLRVLGEAGILHNESKPIRVGGPTEYPADLTVAITSFKRSKHLDRALGSAAAVAGHIVVATMEPDKEVDLVLARWQACLGRRLKVVRLATDLGCNELWLQAVYHSPTERVIVLHDDDFLDPKLKGVYERYIAPFLDSGGGFASWRGHVVWDNGERRAIEWFDGPSRTLSTRAMEDFVGKRERLSLSPVVSVLRRSVLLDALKEAQQCLTAPECLLRPGMLLGTEILAYLRHCSGFDSWLYVDEVLSFYGAHDGSGTVQAEKSSNLQPLIAGYDFARNHYYQHRLNPPALQPRLLLVSSEYVAADADEARRIAVAHATWDFHFNHGAMLDFPVSLSELYRSSARFGDLRPVPYFKDLVAYAIRLARPEDVIVYANRDICLTVMAVDRILAGVERGGGITVATRRDWAGTQPTGLRRTVLNCKPDGGFDLFAFTLEWWRRNSSKMPDMLVGREAWDTVFRTVAEEIGAGAAVYSDDVCYHENHMSFWITERFTNGGQLYNRKLALQFFKERPSNSKSPYMIKLLEA